MVECSVALLTSDSARGDVRMPKSEKLFDMLQLIREYPDLNASDLSRLCDVSERGIYRYLNTLSRAGIPVRLKHGGYRLQEDYTDILDDILKKAGPEVMESLRLLLSLGMRICEDDRVAEHGRDLMKLIEMSLPGKGKLPSNEIEIVPEGVGAVHRGGTITMGHSSRPDIINPILTSETISVDLMNLIFSSLVRFDAAQKPVPDLAEAWEVSDDGLMWTFFIRDDVRFHDGYPLRARDVEFTYGSIMDPENASPMAERYELIDRVETEGDYVFRIVLRYPCASLLHRLSRAIAPEHLLENLDLRSASFNRRPVGSGPFRLTDWTDDDTITLDANKEYFQRGRPILDRLIFKAYPDRRRALQAIAGGKMDVALNLAASDLLFASRHKAFRVYSALGASCYAVILNLRSPIFKDVRVRKALDYAIDRDSIISNQLKGHSRICTGPFGVNSWAYDPNVQPLPYDVQKARELLAQAGWEDTDGDGVLDRDGEPFELSLTVPNISDSLERIAVAIRAQLTKAGIRVKLVYVDDPKSDGRSFQAMLVKMAAGADPDYAYGFWHSQSGDVNLASYQNKSVDDLLELGRRTTDLEERKAIYHEVHEIIHHDCPAIFLASGCEFIGSNYLFGSARFSSTLHFLTSAKDWQIAGMEGADALSKHQRKMKSS